MAVSNYNPPAVQKAIDGLGARVECFYFAPGEEDALAIVEVPHEVTIAAASLAITPPVKRLLRL